MLKRHEMQVLLKAGHSQAEVAQLTGASVRSVKRVAKEGDVAHVDDAAERRTRGIGRPSLVEDFRKPVSDLLEQERDLQSVEVLRRMRLAGYTGQKTALFALIAAVRPKDQTPLVRFEGLPGEFSQHDFGQVDVEYVDGATQRIRFFASRPVGGGGRSGDGRSPRSHNPSSVNLRPAPNSLWRKWPSLTS